MEKDRKLKLKGISRRTFIKYAGTAAAAAGTGFFHNIAVGKVPEVKIGHINPLSGPLAITASHVVAGTKLGVDEINAKGGIKSLGGAKLTVIDADSQGKPEIGMAEAEKLIQAGCIALVGAFQSSVTLTASEVAQRFRTPFLCTIGIADEITQRGYEYVFRLEQSASRGAEDYDEAIAWLEKKTGEPIRTSVNIHENTLFGVSMAGFLRKALGKHSKLNIIKEISYPHTTKDLTSEIIQIKGLNPDIITPTSYEQDGMLMTRTLYEQRVDLKACIACCSAGHFGEHIIRPLGNLQEYICIVNAFVNPKHPRYNEIKQKFESKNKIIWNVYSAHGYDAVQVIADALERAGTTEKDKLRDAISKTNKVIGTILCDPPAIRFGSDGQNVSAKFGLIQCLGQKDTVIWPEAIKERDPVFPVPKWKDRKI